MFKKFVKYFPTSHKSKGLTLIEILVTASLMVFVSALVIRNSSITRINLDRVANVVASDVRLAQSMALSSRKYQYLGAYPGDPNADPSPRNRCGYGISIEHQSATRYFVYAGPPTINPNGTPRNCGPSSYQPSAQQDTPAYKTVLLDPQNRVVFDVTPPSKDIYYEPPGPTTYIGNNQNSSVEKIKIMKAGLTNQQINACDNAASTNCIFVCAYLSGRVEITRGPACP